MSRQEEIWKEVGLGNASGVSPGASAFKGGRWWHHQVGTGKLFVHTGFGAGDGSCPAGCDYHEIDGEGVCLDGEGNPCGSAPKAKGFNDVQPDCGWAGPAYRDGTGQWRCPVVAGCKAGQVKDIHGNCVSAGVKRGQCASNESFNPVTGKCEAFTHSDNDCAANELIDLATGKCAPICGDGNRRTNGLCPSAPNVVPPLPAPKVDPVPPVTPPALSAKSAMPWLIGIGLLAGAGTLVYLASKNNSAQPAAKKSFFKPRRRRLRR